MNMSVWAALPVSELPSFASEPGLSRSDDFAWQGKGVYRPPDFAGYFPQDPEGADALTNWWATMNASKTDARAGLVLVRHGLRCYSGPTTPLLRWVGNTFIRGQDAQDPAAIELMYHASGYSAFTAEDNGTRSAAIHYGLSLVRPKTDALLQSLVDLCMVVDDPTDLSRVAWGLGAERHRALLRLRPYLESTDVVTQGKADVVRRIFNRELKALDWAEERHISMLRSTVDVQVPTLANRLRAGSTAERIEALDTIETQRIEGILDESHIDDFGHCALDEDPVVRERVARLVGRRWIGAVAIPEAGAVTLILRLSYDGAQEVRAAAVHDGLTIIRNKDRRVLHRLLEIAFSEKDTALYQRILWGLRGDQKAVHPLLAGYAKSNRPATVAGAHRVNRDLAEVWNGPS